MPGHRTKPRISWPCPRRPLAPHPTKRLPSRRSSRATPSGRTRGRCHQGEDRAQFFQARGLDGQHPRRSAADRAFWVQRPHDRLAQRSASKLELAFSQARRHHQRTRARLMDCSRHPRQRRSSAARSRPSTATSRPARSNTSSIGHGTKRPRRMFTDADLDEFIADQTRKDVPCPSTATSARRTGNSTSSSEVIAFTALRRPRPGVKPKK